MVLGARTLLVAPGIGITTRSKKLIGTKSIATRKKKLLVARTLLGALGIATRSKDATSSKGHSTQTTS